MTQQPKIKFQYQCLLNWICKDRMQIKFSGVNQIVSNKLLYTNENVFELLNELIVNSKKNLEQVVFILVFRIASKLILSIMSWYY